MSRWDALRCESSGASASSSRRGCKNTIGNHSRNLNSQGRGRQPVSSNSRRTCNNSTDSNFNWRRRTADNKDVLCSSNLPKATAEEETVKRALENLQTAITSDEDVQYSIQQLAISIFGLEFKFIDRPCCFLHNSKIDSTKPLSNVSNAVIWETSYSLLHHIQLLSSQSKQEESNSDTTKFRIQFILNISLVLLPCLQSIIHNRSQQQQLHNAQPACTDLRLCECATIFLNLLGCEEPELLDSFNDDDRNMICKGVLFLCLAKILTISTINARIIPPSNPNSNTIREKRRGPLFPWGAEKTVNLIVKQSVLPFLELSTKGGDDMSVSVKVNYCNGAMECLYILLQDSDWDDKSLNNQMPSHLSKHASAILAPLIVDVSSDGKENQRSNPLRSRTLNAISCFWEWSHEMIGDQSSTEEGNDVMLMSCQYMSAALNALSVLRKGKNQNNLKDAAHEVDVTTIARQLQNVMQNENLQIFRPKFLNILTLLCVTYPNASSSQWHLFLERSTVKESSLLIALEQGTSALGRSENVEDECWSILRTALRATSTLLTAMPFTLWIAGDARPSMRMVRGNFSSRVRSALLNVFECIYNLMTAIKSRISCEWLSNAQSMETVMKDISQMAGNICTILPFNGENSILLQPAMRLVQCAGDIYVLAVKAMSSKRLIPKAELEHTLLYKAMSSFSHVFTASLGAKQRSTHPFVKWLSDASSYDFIGLLLTDSCWVRPLMKDRMEILSLVAKISPSTLAREPFNLASFCELCEVQSQSQNDVDSRILGFKLIESFIIGRKDSLVDCIPAPNNVLFTIPESFCSLLLVALEDKNSATVRSCAVSSFGHLMTQDWIGIFQLKADCGMKDLQIDWTTLESILKLCSAKEEKIASVRSSSCKAIGDICSACICHNETFSVEFVHSFSYKIFEVMALALFDKVASVRSMALFAIGNTSMDLKKYCIDRDTSSSFSSAKELFPSVCECINDKDEKVVANAIRSISHTAYFVYSPEYYSNTQNDTVAIDTYSTLLSKLSSKVNFALDDAIGETPSGLTWKQRNGAKKQSWGSCTTIGTLLSFNNVLPLLEDSLLESTLSSLFRCIQLSNIINEKISAAAVDALSGLPIELWQHLSCKCDSIGCGLATCFCFLDEAQQRKTKTTYYEDVESLANLLLVQAKKNDFCILFLMQERIPFSIEDFYQWLVTHDTNGIVFEEIAAAVSSQEVAQIVDVSVAQMFLSRRIQQHRNQDSPCKVTENASLPLDENSDEEVEDEL